MVPLINTYNIKVVREAGPEPITGEMYNRAEEDIKIDSISEKSAYQLAQILTTLTFHGQVIRVYINGKEYFNEKF